MLRILLDHCTPATLAEEFTPHQVTTAQEMGWTRLSNGELLRAAAEKFDVLISTDKGLPHQQNQESLPLSVIVLRAMTNRLDDLRPLARLALEALEDPNRPTLLVVEEKK